MTARGKGIMKSLALISVLVGLCLGSAVFGATASKTLTEEVDTDAEVSAVVTKRLAQGYTYITITKAWTNSHKWSIYCSKETGDEK